MKYADLSKALFFSGLLTLSMAAKADAALITVSSVTGSGTYTNSPELLIDGTIPSEGTSWTAGTNVYWNGTAPNFTFEFDALYTVEEMQIQVDNNDDYLIEYSQDGTSWSNLFAVSRSSGTVGAGMDTFTQGEISFFPVDARYLRVSATGGDNMYAISEVQAFGSPVPEPGALVLFASGMFAIRVFRKKR